MSHLPKCNYRLLSPPKRGYLQQVSNFRFIVVFFLTYSVLAAKLFSVLLAVVKESLLLELPGEERVTEQSKSKMLVDVYEFFINKFHKTLFISRVWFWHMTSLDITKAIRKVHIIGNLNWTNRWGSKSFGSITDSRKRSASETNRLAGTTLLNFRLMNYKNFAECWFSWFI